MAADPVTASPESAASQVMGSQSTGAFDRLTVQLKALTVFFGAVGGAYYGFVKLQGSLGLSAPECAGIVLSLLALLFFTYTLPTVLEGRRKTRLAEIRGSVKPGYFQLVPREEEASFRRPDGKHDEVFKWLQRPPSNLLYLTGSSGAGKSSLLSAWVLPKLERDDVKIVRLRGYEDPGKALETELKRPSAIWKRNAPETTDLNALFEDAKRKVHPARIVMVFDQFEEFLILQEEQVRARFVEFLTKQADSRGAGSTILLVFRAEYEGFVQNLKLPTAIPGHNLQRVSAFTQRDAEDFLVGSGLKFQEQLLSDVLREAAEVEETKGLIRPVTLNLCGLVLARFATGLPHSFRPGRLVRGFVHESIFQKEIREASPILLPKLISHKITKQPRSIDDLAQGTSLSPKEVQGVMFHLGSPERGIVRALDSDYAVWEISHDFLVPMIDSILAQWRISAWKRARPWLPLAYVAALAGVLLIAPRLFPDPMAELSSQGWMIIRIDTMKSQSLFKDASEAGAKYFFELDSHVSLSDSVRALRRVHSPFAVGIYFLQGGDPNPIGDWSKVTNLRDLRISGSLSHFSDLKKLPRSLRSLNLTFCDRFTDMEIKNLPGSLTSLDISANKNITDAGMRDLPGSLTSLDISANKNITDAGMRDLPKSLTSLKLADDESITDAGLRDLPRSLTMLDLSNNDSITDAGLRDLPRSLTSLNISRDHNITDAGLNNLPSSVTELTLGFNHDLTDAAIKRLPATIHATVYK